MIFKLELKNIDQHEETKWQMFNSEKQKRIIINVISKNMNLVEDFYANIIAPQLKTGLIMETWGIVSSFYRNHNGYKFKVYQRISLQCTLPYVCMSDINRMTTQQKRGGTTFSFLHAKMQSIINQTFIERQSC